MMKTKQKKTENEKENQKTQKQKNDKYDKNEKLNLINSFFFFCSYSDFIVLPLEKTKILIFQNKL